jgi:hypothetical protein
MAAARGVFAPGGQANNNNPLAARDRKARRASVSGAPDSCRMPRAAGSSDSSGTRR